MRAKQRDAPRQRADVVLVERGFFESRAKAQEAIAAGHVVVDGRVLLKPSDSIADAAQVEASPLYPWVSRGGLKLVSALDAFGFDPKGFVCLDIGASTGGFTHVLLDRGAKRVHAIDVGHGQLHAKLRDDPRVDAREGQDARQLTAALFTEAPRFITCDASFISLKLVLPHVLGLAAANALLVALIKPQFEVGPAHVIKGIVKSEEARAKACTDIVACVEACGWIVKGVMPSPVTGSDGNQEYLLAASSSSLKPDSL
jgi:23S rRNA (cytidine1920-2'-O)/16S rRNA (cytidine1409-2'-O)-methyltransferase